MKECPNCQTENPDGAKFCMNCGSKMVQICPQCQTENPAGARFCMNCGHQLATSKSSQSAPKAAAPPEHSPFERFIPREFATKLEDARSSRAMEGERRVVTMMFCDIKGSTAAARRLDPEEWAEIINGAFEHMIGPVYQYEGTVARLMGDGILAFFGAPIAHEDDPQRGVLAGLEILESIKPYRQGILEKWGLEIDVRIGINTGLVVVGAVGSDLRMEYTALGDAINMAARMEQTAVPGTVQISEHTYKLVAPLFEVSELGKIEIKGLEQPVEAYRVLRQKARPGRLRGVEGLESRLVGRDAEMHTLRGAVIGLRQGQGRIISLMGEAGLGKSRLVSELRQSPTPVPGARVDLRWLEGRSLSYETTTPYAPFIGMLTEFFQLEPGLASEDLYERVQVGVERFTAEGSSEIVPYLASILDIQVTEQDSERVRFLEPPQMRQRVFRAMSELFELLAKDAPTILVFDDIHWIDSTSINLLQALLPLTERVPLLILALFRPRREEISWQFHETAARDHGDRYDTISLRPLDEGSARELVSNLLEIDDLPEHVRQAILAKAEGNPFFMEEVIRSLLDQALIVRDNGRWRATGDIANISVPDTLAAVITTRLDRLDGNSKQVVQTASVIGREFQYETLARAQGEFDPLENALTELQRRELIREKSQLPQREYAFKHAVTQETAYASLLLKRRRQLHQRVAETIEETHPEHMADIGKHFLEADLPQKALPYLLDAGDHAASAYSTPEAIGFYEKALEILEGSDDLPRMRRAYEGLGGALSFANEVPKAVATYKAMLQVAEAQHDVPMQVSALNKLSYMTALRLGDFGGAERYLLEADSRARAEEDKIGLSEMSFIRCMMCTAAADFEGVVHYMGEAVELAQDTGVKEQMALGMAHISSSQIYMLQFEKSWQTAKEGLALTEEIGDLVHQAEILAMPVPLYHLRSGDLQAAYQAAEQAMTIALKIGATQAEAIAARSTGIIAHLRGDYEGAIASYQHYLEASRKAGAIWSEAEALCRLGTIHLEISPSQLDRASDYHEKAEEVLEQPGGAMFGGSSWAELGFCNLAVGKLEKAAALFERGLATPTITTKLETPRLLIGSALVAMARSDTDRAAALLSEAEHMVREHEMKSDFPGVCLAQGRLKSMLGQYAGALEAFASAEKSATKMGMLPVIWRAQSGAAQILTQLGRPSEAMEKQQAAAQVVDQIASLFENESLRQEYRMNAVMGLGVG